MKHKLTTAIFALFLITAGAAMAAGSATLGAGSVDFAADGDGVVTVAGPDGFNHRLELKGGHASMSLNDDAGNALADGTYKWQITLDGVAPADRSERGVPGESFSGAFTLAGGSPVNSNALESRKDQVILDDLIVDGSACIGQDCVNGESFGFDTLRLKENNLRIHFQDTSSSASFPTNDWRIVANDSSNGGSNHLSIEDSNAGRNPFRVEAGARANALVVEADGDIGIGTLNPVVDLHVVTGNTPTLRLEQDGSNGFTPQTWDLAGNEANLFIRDATNGSTLPFRIYPGAPTDALTIEANTGDIGLGTTTPDSNLDIQDAAPQFRMTGNDAGFAWVWAMNSGGRLTLNHGNTGDQPLRVESDATDAALTLENQAVGIGTNVPVPAGVLGEVSLDVNGPIFQRGGNIHADYVFEPDYELESIEEHATFMWTNKHLPAVPPRTVDGQGKEILELGAHRQGMLEELEKAHIYIEQLQRQLNDKTDTLSVVEGRLARLEALLAE